MKILYYYSQLNIGGAEKSTIRLLNLMVDSGWDVTILLRWDSGIIENDLKTNVKVIHLKHERKNRYFGKFGDFLWFILQTVLCKFREFKLRNEAYDVAISGLFGYNPRILLKNIKAKQYIQMLRNDVEKTRKYGKTQCYMERYGSYFDYFVGVSEYTTQTFRNCFPELADRAVTIYNVVSNIESSQEYADPFPRNMEHFIRILTVGRLVDKAKGLYRMIDVAEKMIADGYTGFKWYIVGDGEDRSEFEERCKQRGMDQIFVMCGKQSDPFPYYRYADIVAVLSYYEGLCGVVNEAKLMNKCVIATKFSGIEEQLVHEENGLIVDNNTDAIVCGMERLLKDPELRIGLSRKGLPKEIMDNNMKIQQFENLFLHQK